MVRLLQIVFIAVIILFIVKLVKSIMKYKSGKSPSVDDLKHRAENLRRKMNDIQEADFREIPPDDKTESKNPQS